MKCHCCEKTAKWLLNYKTDPAEKDLPACDDLAEICKKNWAHEYVAKSAVFSRFQLLEID